MGTFPNYLEFLPQMRGVTQKHCKEFTQWCFVFFGTKCKWGKTHTALFVLLKEPVNQKLE